MLVLSRKSSESVVVLGNDGLEPTVKVTVLEIYEGSVRLGFVAEGSVPIHRFEVWEKIRNGERPNGQQRVAKFP
jgi:carbon storage regulator CsrA